MRRSPLSRKAAYLALVAAANGALLVSLLRSDDRPATGPIAVSSSTAAASVPSSLPADPVLARIRDEGLNRSKAPETIDYLCNVIGPRLTGSPGLRTAAAWTRDTLAAWGLADARLETWGPFGRGWSVERFSIQATEPTAFVLNGYPKAWSPGFAEPLEAEVVYVEAKNEAEMAPYKGKLSGKIVLLGQIREPEVPLVAPATRMSDEQLAKLAASRPSADLTTAPASAPVTSPAGELLVPRAGADASPTTGPASPARQLATARSAARMFALVAAESPALVLSPSGVGDGGIHFVTGVALPTDPLPGGAATFGTGPATRPRPWTPDAPPTPPQVVLAVEDFNRLVRIAKRHVPVKVRTELRVRFHDDDPMVPNVLAEIPGTDLADEVVMIGAHLDSWHAGTGATDNAAGSVAVMEAVRIIRALDLKPRRTIRVALWTGEEQGLLGSAAYAKQHLGRLDDPPGTTQPATQPTTGPGSRPSSRAATRRASTRPAVLVKGPDYERLSVYFNLDNGAGRVRGIYCQGNDSAMPLFRQWLDPLADLGARTVTLSNTGATDHVSFDRIGLPGFQFIQDPLDYRARTHHSNQDNFDRVPMADLKQSATVIAWFAWKAANEPERFPRKPLAATRPG